jgi:AcrR family transcriptional regulator
VARARSAHFELNRDTIVRAAAALFAAHGYPGTSMNDVARACGVSKPLLYHYVDDKYRLLLEIADGHVTRLEAIVAEVDALDLAPQDRLRRLIHRFVDEYAQARHEHGVLTQDVKFLLPADGERVLGKERRVVEAFARAVAAARPDLDASTLSKPLAMLLFGMMNWMFTWLRPDGRLTHHDMAPIVADLFLGGLDSLAGASAPLPARQRAAPLRQRPLRPSSPARGR